MKIAFIVPQFPCLSETFILNQMTGLLDAGHQIQIFAQDTPPPDAKMHEDIELYQLQQYQQSLLDLRYESKLTFSHLWAFLAVFLSMPRAAWTAFNNKRYGQGALNRLLMLRMFQRSTNQFLDNVDVIHAHFGSMGLVGVFLRDVGLLAGRLVVTFHGFDFSKLTKIHGPDYYAYLFNTCDACFAISEDCAAQLKQLGCPPDKIFIHRVSYDSKRLQFQVKPPSPTLHLVSIARFVEKKGLVYGIQALAKARVSYPNLRYTLIGDGPLRPEIEAEIQRLNLQDVVVLAGWKTQAEMSLILKQADIMLVPSVTAADGDQEGLPTVIYEAMAMGIVVIASVHAGIPEVVRDGETGFLAPEKDVDTLAHKILWCANNRFELSGIREAARAYALGNHTIDVLCEQQVGYYRKLQRTLTG